MEKYGNIKMVIFDFDGTIVPLEVDWESVKKELSTYFESAYDYESNFTPLYQEIDRVNDLFGRKAREEAVAIIEKHESAGIEQLQFIPKAVRLIESLKDKGTKLAIFSSNTRKVVEEILRKIDKLDSFEVIVTIEDVSKNKPDPEGLHKILRTCKVSRSEALFIGDGQRDLEAGKRARVNTICIGDLRA